MPTAYRDTDGKFRKPMLEDFGASMVICRKCHFANSYAKFSWRLVNGQLEKTTNPPPVYCDGCGERLTHAGR